MANGTIEIQTAPPSSALQPGSRPVAGRTPPQAMDVEKAVLGAMLIDKEAVPKALEVLDVAAFYHPTHQKLYGAMISLFEKGEAIDSVTVVEELRRKGTLNPAEDPVYITELTMNVTSSANIDYHARIVLEKALMRSLISASSSVAARAYSDTEDALDLLDEAEAKIFQISERRLKKAFTPINRALHETFAMLEEIHGKHSGVTGVPSGFPLLDEKTGGFQNSDLIIIAGRPSQGKTALALAVARNAALHPEKKTSVAIFSLEMSEQQLIIRMLSAEARVNAHQLRTGKLPDENWKYLSRNVGKLAEAKIFIDDSAALSILELRAKARRLKAEHNIGLVIVDYLQLVSGPKSAESREREISMISRSLKALAKELNIPVIALSQLNRALEARGDKRPVLADLRECVTGDTLVVLADGRRIPIRELSGQQAEVLTMTKSGRIGVALCDAIWSVGIKPVVKVKLASGRYIRVTDKHRLYTINGWQEVKELATGDRLGMARSIPEPHSRVERWPDDRLTLLGQLIGDGSYLSGQPLRYTTSSEDNSDAVRRAALNEFGTNVTRYRGRRSWHQLLLSGNGNRWHPEGVNRWLRELGIFNQRSYQKRVPQGLFQLTNDQIALFLKHLWATDGCIHSRTSGSSTIYYATNSEGLAYDVAALLLRFGIVARIRSTQKAQYRPGFQVIITGIDQFFKFLGSVGTFGPRRMQGDRLAASLEGVASNTNVDTIPIEVFDLVRARMREQGISQREMSHRRGTSYGGTSHFKFAPSRSTLLEYAELLDDTFLEEFATNDLFWDRIVSIEPDGEEEVFDLTVPGTASWLADGIISHNSGAIEQDADVVIFVHRPETYGIKEVRDVDGTSIDAEGIAEIIIGKQRNGPTGQALLTFVKDYAGFERRAPRSLEGYLPPPPVVEGEPPF